MILQTLIIACAAIASPARNRNIVTNDLGEKLMVAPVPDCYNPDSKEYQKCSDYDPCMDSNNSTYYPKGENECTLCADSSYDDPNWNCCYNKKGSRIKCGQ
jgi:hypothetical protein